jgi:hypothetical protein
VAAPIGVIADLDQSLIATTGDETRANASLIAAAPDLLAACKAVLTDLECPLAGFALGPPPALRRVIETIKSAINKAEGKA